MESYSEKVKNEWKVEVIEEKDSQVVNIDGSSEMQLEDADDSSVLRSVDESCMTNSNMVMILLFLALI